MTCEAAQRETDAPPCTASAGAPPTGLKATALKPHCSQAEPSLCHHRLCLVFSFAHTVCRTCKPAGAAALASCIASPTPRSLQIGKSQT